MIRLTTAAFTSISSARNGPCCLISVISRRCRQKKYCGFWMCWFLTPVWTTFSVLTGCFASRRADHDYGGLTAKLNVSCGARWAPATQRNRVFANDGYMATQFFFRPEV